MLRQHESHSSRTEGTHVGRAEDKSAPSDGARSSASPHPESDAFPSTIWMRVELAGDQTQPRSREALAELCEAYWHPVYAFIRRKGNDPDRAADLTQGFFTLLIETGALAAVTPEKGKIPLVSHGGLHSFLEQPAGL